HQDAYFFSTLRGRCWPIKNLRLSVRRRRMVSLSGWGAMGPDDKPVAPPLVFEDHPLPTSPHRSSSRTGRTHPDLDPSRGRPRPLGLRVGPGYGQSVSVAEYVILPLAAV